MSPITPEQREEIARAVAANRATQNALSEDRGKGKAPELKIKLVRSSDEPLLFSSESQAEIREMLSAFGRDNIEVHAPFMTMDSPGAGGGYLGEFMVALGAIAAVARPLATIISAWLKARSGRKVRVEFFSDGRPKRIEATSDDEVISIFEAVQSETERKHPKKTK